MKTYLAMMVAMIGLSASSTFAQPVPLRVFRAPTELVTPEAKALDRAVADVTRQLGKWKKEAKVVAGAPVALEILSRRVPRIRRTLPASAGVHE